MKPNEAARLATSLTRRFGLPLTAEVDSSVGGSFVTLEPLGIHRHEGFSIHIQPGWRHLYTEFRPGRFAAPLLQQMGACSPEKKAMFAATARYILADRAHLDFKINDQPWSPVYPDTWPDNWKMFKFSMRNSGLEINTENHALSEQLIESWIGKFFGCVFALIPLSDVEDADQLPEARGFPEGAVTTVTVNRYERSRYNRALCISFHGTACSVCGIDFGKVYGPAGHGFIHVHHLTPIARLGPDYCINPIEDLIPVCPNCHSMLHRKDPPYTINELKILMHLNTSDKSL